MLRLNDGVGHDSDVEQIAIAARGEIGRRNAMLIGTCQERRGVRIQETSEQERKSRRAVLFERKASWWGRGPGFSGGLDVGCRRLFRAGTGSSNWREMMRGLLQRGLDVS
jgi:hypothetical protein